MIKPQVVNFGNRVAKSLKKQIPTQATNSETIDGLTAEQIAAGVTKEHIDLPLVVNAPLKTSWTATDVPSNDYATPKSVTDQFNLIFNGLLGTDAEGKCVFVDPSVETKMVAEDSIDETIGPVVGAVELETCRAVALQEYLFETIGQTLYRRVGTLYEVVAATEIPKFIKPGRMYYNKGTKCLFYAETSYALFKF